MLVLPCIVIQSRVRRSLIGALATDPVIREPRQPPRRSLLAAIARTPATAGQS